MSTARLQAAREFILNEEYDLARRILHTLGDSATAQKWLAQLDQIAPAAAAAAEDEEDGSMMRWEDMEVFVRAGDRVPFNLREALDDQPFTMVDHQHTRMLNDYGAQGWELISEAMEGGDLVRLLFKRPAK